MKSLAASDREGLVRHSVHQAYYSLIGRDFEQELMPLRIEHEKQEREKMEQERLELVKAKDALVKENTRKKDELKKMDEKLEAMIDGFKPMEEALQKDL